MSGLNKFLKILPPQTAAIIFSEKTRQYLTGFKSSDGSMIITSDKSFLFLDSRYIEAGKLLIESSDIAGKLEVLPSGFNENLSKLLNSGEIKFLWYEDRFLTCNAFSKLRDKYKNAEFVSMGDAADKLRIIKTPAEVEKIKEAQRLTESAFDYILNLLKPGITETEVAANIDFFIKRNGGTCAFDTICVSGRKSSMPHGVPENIEIQKNCFITMDFGARLDGYCSDMTRTVCLGRTDEKMKTVYETVLEAQLSAIKAVHGDIEGNKVDAAARDIIKSAGYGDYFGHSTGHGIGIEVHEAPSFSPANNNIVPSGAVLSVEPGVYLPGEFGVRIEDMVLVTDEGCENLTKTPKTLLEL